MATKSVNHSPSGPATLLKQNSFTMRYFHVNFTKYLILAVLWNTCENLQAFRAYTAKMYFELFDYVCKSSILDVWEGLEFGKKLLPRTNFNVLMSIIREHYKLIWIIIAELRKYTYSIHLFTYQNRRVGVERRDSRGLEMSSLAKYFCKIFLLQLWELLGAKFVGTSDPGQSSFCCS